VAPRERHVLAEQRAVLLPRERRAAQELHRRRRGSGGWEPRVFSGGGSGPVRERSPRVIYIATVYMDLIIIMARDTVSLQITDFDVERCISIISTHYTFPHA
jgi:hypothetical protein